MPRVVAVAVPPSPTGPRLELSPSSSSSSPSPLTAPSDAITAANLLTTLAAAGQSLKSTEALIAQKQHQTVYIQQQQRLQQENQRQLIYSQQQRHQQYLRCSGQLSFTTPYQQSEGQSGNNGKSKAMGSAGKGKEPRAADLVDDVWRLVFFILAYDCKDLGRAMQVSRRFHNLIASDALLWRLTYKLTISGSIFAGQKPLLSPSWIREHQLSGQGASGSALSSASTHQDQSGSAPSGAILHTLKKTSGYMDDGNEDGLDSTPSNTDEHGLRRGSVGHAGVASSSGLSGSGYATTSSALTSFRPHPGSQSTGALLQPNNNSNSINDYHTAVAMTPGLQMPSPLILPHHRRIAQSITTMNPCSGQPITVTPAQVARSSQSQILYFSEATTNSSNENLESTITRTPASTPAMTSMPSFPSTLSSSISQVAAISSSTTPIRVIQHHIPSTTLMHHSPAVYWKHQVAEWLEQEKLRCLRLGLFWGFNAAASKAHGRKPHRTL